jgi:ribosomal protein S18 acetylase RimI-like enzyme
MHIAIQPLLKADIDSTDTVIQAAYASSSRKTTLYYYLHIQPDGAFVAKKADAIVGFGGFLDYDDFAYIGMMSVAPGEQRQGIGQRLLEAILNHLEERGCPTVLLDASPSGAPLYRRYGFYDDGEALVLKKSQQVKLPGSGAESILSATEADLPELLALDASMFGGNRGRLLKMYWAENPERTLIARDEYGQIGGYLLAQANVLGPWIARSQEVAERLLLAGLALPFQEAPQVFVAAEHRDALALLTRYGFTFQRSLQHMYKGTRIARPRTTNIFGQASLGFG